jgi:acetolactate synthase small subunit
MPQNAPEQPEQQQEEIIPQGKVKNYRQASAMHAEFIAVKARAAPTEQQRWSTAAFSWLCSSGGS